MIISVKDLSNYIDTSSYSDDKIRMLLDSMETMVRRRTNNHFHVRSIRFNLEVISGQLVGNFHHLSVGDTIEVSESEYNHGHVSEITAIEGDVITLYKPLQDEDVPVTITKVVYPSDIVQGVINLMNWELNNRDKVGIKSESLSRHSVTYADASEYISGYPQSLMEFIKPYCKARF